MGFNEAYFNDDSRLYERFGHFAERARWIKDNLSGKILEIGCACGYLIEELAKLGITIEGIDKSVYAFSRKSLDSSIILADVADYDWEGSHFDWVISWNALDCFNDEDHTGKIASVLNAISTNQLHVLSMSEKRSKYTDLGYFIRDVTFWRKNFPKAILVCSECRAVYNPTEFEFSQIPLHVGKGASD